MNVGATLFRFGIADVCVGVTGSTFIADTDNRIDLD